MNLLINKVNISGIRRNKEIRYFASGAAAFLVFGAIVGFSGAVKSSTISQVAANPEATNVASDAPSYVTPLRVYIADTPEQALAMEKDQVGASDPATIVVKGSLLEQDLLGASGTVAGTGRTIEIISGPRTNDEPLDAYAAQEAAQIEIAHQQPVVPMFATAADAVEAARGLVQVSEYAHPFMGQPLFSTGADAEFAARALVPDAALR